jgi:acyl-CoA thioesterase-1
MIDLWGHDVSRLVWFYAAGKPFFPGVGLLIISAAMPVSRLAIWVNIIKYAFIILGIAQVYFSATPIGVWIYAVWAASLAAFLYVILRPVHNVKRANLTRIVFMFICLIALLAELPFHLKPKIPSGNFEKLYVVGDSVSAGVGGKNEKPWPAILGEKYEIEVNNLSVGGATAGSILPQAEKIEDNDAIVLFEIGGNDLLSMTPKPVFEENLRFLLRKAVRPNRLVLMLELPLGPWHIGYGRIQRKLAAEFGVILVPKTFFADILGAKGATVDLAHLSPKGNEIMADKVWFLLSTHLQVKPK